MTQDMRICLTILLSVVVTWLSATPQYHTRRLEQIAQKAGIVIPDSLLPGTKIDSIATINGHAICLRTNGFGDVAHIGYSLFDQKLMSYYGRIPLFEFVERYLLELDLDLSNLGMSKRMEVDRVVMVEGNWSAIRQLKPKANVSVKMEEIVRHMMRLTFESNGQRAVVTIPIDSQLLLGANAIELEQIVLRDIQRMVPLTVDDTWGYNWEQLPRTRAGKIEIADGGYYMIDKIRGDLYFNRNQGKLQLICSAKNPVRSISNLMLTGQAKSVIAMKLIMNEYGQKTDTIQIALQQLIGYFRSENCRMYFGVKSHSNGFLAGTLFAYNQNLAYTHMVSVEFPISILSSQEGCVKGTAYVYIPIQHISDKYFTQEFNPITE